MFKVFLIYLFINYFVLEVCNFFCYKDKPVYKQIWEELAYGEPGITKYLAVLFLFLFGWTMIISDWFNGKFK